MGLDIMAIERVELVQAMDIKAFNAEQDGECPEDDQDYLWTGGGVNRMDGLPDGIYKVSGKRVGFRAGSYGGYNQWRDMLARLTGTTAKRVWSSGDDALGPFVELINFSDCEGTIGPKTSAKLLFDFNNWRERASAFASRMGEDGQWWLTKYEEWADAFLLASNGGCVEFH